MGSLIYGGGLRVSECCELRVKDVDFDQGLLFVRGGKGNKDRSTLTRRGHAAAAAPRSRENLRRFTGHLRCCGKSGNPFNLPQAELGGINEERGGPIFLPRGTRGGADLLDAHACGVQ